MDIFSGGALTQDSTSFDYKASAAKVLSAHTVGFGGEFERDRIDADDYSYTPGDNTFQRRTHRGAHGRRPAGRNHQTSGSALADFYLGSGLAVLPGQWTQVLSPGEPALPLCAGRLEGELAD